MNSPPEAAQVTSPQASPITARCTTMTRRTSTTSPTIIPNHLSTHGFRTVPALHLILTPLFYPLALPSHKSPTITPIPTAAVTPSVIQGTVLTAPPALQSSWSRNRLNALGERGRKSWQHPRSAKPPAAGASMLAMLYASFAAMTSLPRSHATDTWSRTLADGTSLVP